MGSYHQTSRGMNITGRENDLGRGIVHMRNISCGPKEELLDALIIKPACESKTFSCAESQKPKSMQRRGHILSHLI